MASLATAVVAPTVLFAATLVTFDVMVAVTVALAWVAGATCWRWATGRPVSGLLMLTLGIMTVRTGFTLASGNTFVYFVQPVFADATVAAIFLGSLLTARPIVARLAPDFYPIDATLAARPRIRRLFRRLTLLWGLVIVLKASVTLWLLRVSVDGSLRADPEQLDHRPHADCDRRHRRPVRRRGPPGRRLPPRSVTRGPLDRSRRRPFPGD